MFIDDFWLVTPVRGSHSPLSLRFFNTEQMKTENGKLAQTTFHFDPHQHKDLGIPGLGSDLGGHEPSHEDHLFAPFYPNPSQRVLPLWFSRDDRLLVVKIETLLKLAQERESEDIQWEEWQPHVTWVQRTSQTARFGVSGNRLCCVYSTESGGASMDVYDFGAGASTRHMETAEGGAVWRVTPDITKALPWRVDDILLLYGCHDSLAFVLNPRDGSEYTVHMWNFV